MCSLICDASTIVESFMLKLPTFGKLPGKCLVPIDTRQKAFCHGSLWHWQPVRCAAAMRAAVPPAHLPGGDIFSMWRAPSTHQTNRLAQRDVD